MPDISNTADIIDSRDVIARIEQLESDRESVEEEGKRGRLKEWDDEYGAELAALKALADEAEGYAPDWHHGAALIRDSYFTTYAQDVADDLGVCNGTEWPLTCIDWDQAARELQMDYTAVDFDGVTYWIR